MQQSALIPFTHAALAMPAHDLTGHQSRNHRPVLHCACAGMLQQLLCQPQHAQQALQLLHLLVQSVSLCQVLNAGLDEGFQLEGGTATAPSPPLRPGGVQEDAAGHSASSPMEIDVDNNDTKDQPTRCCSILFTKASSPLVHVLTLMQSLSALCSSHQYAYSCNHAAYV